MDGSEIAELDATAQAQLVRDGLATPLELVDAAIDMIQRRDPQIGALVYERFDRARSEAQGELPDGPFRGVPMLLKDGVQHSRGDRYQHGLRALAEQPWYSPDDTTLVRRYREAGFVIVARSKVPELTSSATTEPVAHGPVHNPWALDHSTGGSSGGSSAAVAARMVPVAHANDMGGSIRIPASCCGLVGLKPSRDRTSPGPDRGEYWGPLTHEHVVARTVRDSAAVLDATAGPTPGDLHRAPPPARPWLDEVGADVAPLRVGLIVDSTDGEPVDPECVEAATRTAEVLESAGHHVEPAPAGPLTDSAGMAAFSAVVAASLAGDALRWERVLGRPLDDLEPQNAEIVATGRSLSATDLVAAVDELARYSRRVTRSYEHFDVLVTPTLATKPPRLGTLAPLSPAAERLAVGRLMSMFTRPFNVTGQPAVTVPVHWSADGLPIGAQLVAAVAREDLLIRLASLLETALPWSGRRPNLNG